MTATVSVTLTDELVAAVDDGDAAAVHRLLDRGADPCARSPHDGLTVLMMAAGRGDQACVRLLLDAGADVFTADSGAGATALHKACQGGGLDVVRSLVAAGAFVDAVAPTTGHTPLMDALWFKFPEVARFLLDAGAGLNLSTHYGFSLKEHFAYELNVNTIGKDRLLLAEKYLNARISSDEEQRAGEHRLMAAVTAGDAAEVNRLLDAGAAVDERFPVLNGFNDGHTALLVAARDGHTEIAAALLRAGADVNAIEPTFGSVPLHKAVYNGHADLTRLISGWPGVDLNFRGWTNGYTPLHDAVWHGYAECVRILQQAGADLTLRGDDGGTPYTFAVRVFGADDPLTLSLRGRVGHDPSTDLRRTAAGHDRRGLPAVLARGPRRGVRVQDSADPPLPGGRHRAPGAGGDAAAVARGRRDLAGRRERAGRVVADAGIPAGPSGRADLGRVLADGRARHRRPRTGLRPGGRRQLVLLVKRAPGSGLAEFRERGLGSHAALMERVPGLCRYLQGYTRDAAYQLGEAVLDGAHQLWFEDADALTRALDSTEFARGGGPAFLRGPAIPAAASRHRALDHRPARR